MARSVVWGVAMLCAVSACSARRTELQDDAAVTFDGPVNLAPSADAGADTTQVRARAFALDGSGSSDADGTIVDYTWMVLERPPGSTTSIVNDTSAIASFTADVAGTYVFSLVVTDDDDASGSDTVQIVVETGAFTVDAGSDQTVVWQSTVHLSGSFVSEAGPGTVAWRMLSLPMTASQAPLPATSLTPTFFAEKVGTFVAEMEVTTPAGTATDTVTVTVVAPPPDPIDGNIVDVAMDGSTGQFAIASVNPSRIRMLAPYWPTPPSELVIPLTVTPTAIGLDSEEQFVYIVHETTKLTVAWITALSQLSTMELGTSILDVRGGPQPRVYPAQAGPILLVDHQNVMVYPGSTVSGAARGRGQPEVYVVDAGPNGKLRHYDGSSIDTTLVREWPYPGGQYSLGNDLWVIVDKLVTSSGNVFLASEDPLVDMTYRGFLGGDPGFEIVGVASTSFEIATLNVRVPAPPQLPETQVRFYDPDTLALEAVVLLPDLTVGGVARRSIGHAITWHAFPGRVYVIGSAVGSPASAALFTIPTP